MILEFLDEAIVSMTPSAIGGLLNDMSFLRAAPLRSAYFELNNFVLAAIAILVLVIIGHSFYGEKKPDPPKPCDVRIKEVLDELEKVLTDLDQQAVNWAPLSASEVARTVHQKVTVVVSPLRTHKCPGAK